MDQLSLSTLFSVLGILLAISAFFSMSEIGMMALNRYRLKHHAQQGHRGARLTQKLLDRTDKLLAVILLGNNLINTAAAALTTMLAQRLFGAENQTAIGIATAGIAFMIIIFSEAMPKVIASAYPQPIAYAASYILSPLLRLAAPAVWLINSIVSLLMKLLHLDAQQREGGTNPQELRVMVLESAHLIGQKHRSILLNLLDLENITVDDVMTPRRHIEAVNLDQEDEPLFEQLATAHHTRLLLYDGSPDQVIGIIHARKILHLLYKEELSKTRLREFAHTPYYIPAGTPLFTQLSNFQLHKRRIGLVVDEYGEIQGIVALEDIIEEMIGEFTTGAPGQSELWRRQTDGSLLVDGSLSLRVLNRKIGAQFPVDGPKTLNGLILEYLEGLPEPGTCLKIENYPLEILSTGERAVKMVRVGQAMKAANPL